MDNAFQMALFNAQPKSFDLESLNGGTRYLIPQFRLNSQQGFNNGYDLQAGFAYALSQNQTMPLYQIESFWIDQFYDEVDVTVEIKYALTAGLTDTTYVQVKEITSKKPLK